MTPILTLAAAAAILAQVGQQQPAPKPAPAPAPAQQPVSGTPGIPMTPLAVKGVLSVRSFTLTQGYEHDWRQERPVVTEGVLIVLDVEPNAVYPRQSAQPVLYVGNQTAERINVGYLSGKVVAIVPGKVDLATTPIWFGTPMLPEQVSENTIKVERSKADTAGIKPMGKDKASTVATAPKLALADKAALLKEAATLIRTHAPDEAELANNIAPSEGQPQR